MRSFVSYEKRTPDVNEQGLQLVSQVLSPGHNGGGLHSFSRPVDLAGNDFKDCGTDNLHGCMAGPCVAGSDSCCRRVATVGFTSSPTAEMAVAVPECVYH